MHIILRISSCNTTSLEPNTTPLEPSTTPLEHNTTPLEPNYIHMSEYRDTGIVFNPYFHLNKVNILIFPSPKGDYTDGKGWYFSKKI